MFNWLVALIIAASVQVAQAVRYDIVTTPPESGMLAIGAPVKETILNVATMQNVAGTVSGYVVWTGLPRTPEYYVTLPTGGWLILPRNRAEE